MTQGTGTERTGFSGGQLVLALLGGAVVGAAVALLTTPKTGAQMRAQIGSTVQSGRDRVRQLPDAVKGAGVAARDAFVSAMEVAV